jgi:hypothetical protein
MPVIKLSMRESAAGCRIVGTHPNASLARTRSRCEAAFALAVTVWAAVAAIAARSGWRPSSSAIFGDVMYDAHRAWNERACARHGLVPVLPLWGQSTAGLAAEFVATGSAAIIVTARASHLDVSWLGRTLTLDAVRQLQALDVDPCGEEGEFHTLVTSTPLFSTPVDVALGVPVMRPVCWALGCDGRRPGEFDALRLSAIADHIRGRKP